MFRNAIITVMFIISRQSKVFFYHIHNEMTKRTVVSFGVEDLYIQLKHNVSIHERFSAQLYRTFLMCLGWHILVQMFLNNGNCLGIVMSVNGYC